MRVLISAIACNPYLGSENYFGWAAVRCLARSHEVTVVTSTRNRQDLQRATDEGLVPENVTFIYAGTVHEWHPNRLWARIQSWQEYIGFARDSLPVALRAHREKPFAVVHHVTYSTWRVASPMWQLGIPFIYGPIAGNEPYPLRLFPLLSPAGAAFETARNTSNLLSRFFPTVRRSIKEAAHIFAITPESERLMTSIRGASEGISRLSPGFYAPDVAAGFSRFAQSKPGEGPLRLYAAGNLGGQKGIAIALHALAKVKAAGIPFHYLLGSGGPEVPALKRLAVSLNLTNEITFGANMSREAYQQELGRTHLYLLPSMRETVGLTMMEAMLAGCVPIVANNGGPSVMVTDECGYRIPVSTPTRMADEIASTIVRLHGDRALVQRAGQMASARISANYTDANYLNSVQQVYDRVTSHPNTSNR